MTQRSYRIKYNIYAKYTDENAANMARSKATDVKNLEPVWAKI